MAIQDLLFSCPLAKKEKYSPLWNVEKAIIASLVQKFWAKVCVFIFSSSSTTFFCAGVSKSILYNLIYFGRLSFRTTLGPIEQTIEFQIPSSKNPRDLKISSLGWFDGENRNRAKTGLCQILATHGFLFGGSLWLTDWQTFFLGWVSDWRKRSSFRLKAS